MSIYRINNNQTTSEKIRLLNEMIMELNGKITQSKFDKNELDNVYTQLAESTFGLDRLFLRDVLLGNTLGDYADWTHVDAFSGYSIWKIAPTNYAYNAENELYFNNKALENRGSAGSETATTFDHVFVYNGDSGSGYTDNTTEAGTEGGTEFEVMDSSNDYLYVGEASTFAGASFEWQTRASGQTIVVEYWNGTSWDVMTANDNTLDDDTNAFASDGKISWVVPGDWATTTVNSVSEYWVRFSTSTEPTTTAKAYRIIPYNSVISLLALSSTQLQQDDLAWCYYSNSVYVTIKNAGNTAYEGSLFITSASSTENKQNFFIYNNTYKSDYEDSTYSGV